MIVPRNRLFLWVALLLPFALIATTGASGILLSVAYSLGLGVIAVVDVVASQRSFKGIAIKLPLTVRLSKDKEGVLPVQIQNELMRTKLLRIGLPFPREFQSLKESFDIILPKGILASQFDWPCKVIKRGSYQINCCYLETSSIFGLWSIRKSVPAECEIRVYPNLFDERKRLAALFLNRGNFGIHTQRMIGQGREFEKLREYIPGDSYDQIHWKATAKRGYPITKVFQIERTQEVYVIVDTSRLSQKLLGNEIALEYYLKAALIMGLVTEQQGDLFGLMSFSDRPGGFIRAKCGKAHYHICRDTTYHLQPQLVTPNFEEVCSFIRLCLRRRALLIFLTDLSDQVLAENFMKSVDFICRQHLVIVGMIKPESSGPLFQTSRVETIDQIYQRLGTHLMWQHLSELQRSLQHHGVRLLQFAPDQLSAQLVSEYFSIKRRQLI